jgi:hypothetical protein
VIPHQCILYYLRFRNGTFWRLGLFSINVYHDANCNNDYFIKCKLLGYGCVLQFFLLLSGIMCHKKPIDSDHLKVVQLRIFVKTIATFLNFATQINHTVKTYVSNWHAWTYEHTHTCYLNTQCGKIPCPITRWFNTPVCD